MEENTVKIETEDKYYDVRVPIEIIGWRTGTFYPHTIIIHEK